ncbi:MAG: hypothetical protein ACI4V4_03700 [Eubacterium sp.]
MKKKLTAIFLCAVVALTAGVSVAYYNTETFGFDENAKIISKDNDKITFLDFEIYYEDVDNIVSTAREYLPKKPSVMSLNKQHNVVYYKCI